MEESLSNLSRMATQLDAHIEVVHVIELPEIIIQAGPVRPDGPLKVPLSQLPRHSSRQAAGSDRKEKGRQKKKKKKARSKSNNSVSSIVRSAGAKLRPAPGDSAVSSDSEPAQSLSRTLTADHLLSSTPESVPKPASLHESSLVPSLDQLQIDKCAPKRWGTDVPRCPRQASRLGGYQDQICLLTPEERGILRRTGRKERRSQALEEARRTKSKGDGGVTATIASFNEPQGAETEVNRKPQVKFVVEVKVLKTVKREEESFLDFEGFGLG